MSPDPCHMIDQPPVSQDLRRSLRLYVSDTALSALAGRPDGGWTEITGTLAFFDISGFSQLTERLAALGRSGAEHINDVLNTIFTGLIDEVVRVGGDVIEFGGDAMVVLFDGLDHERRAAIAVARMFRFMRADGLVETPLGRVRLRMSCGVASGTQAYHLLGVTRRALIVAGPVSTEMARLEAAANAGEALIGDDLAAALPAAWVDLARDGVTPRLRLHRVPIDESDPPRAPARSATDDDVAMLLPTQFGSLLDANHRAGELKQVAMSFVRLSGTDDLLASDGVESFHRRLREITEIIDAAAAELDVCWLETQAEANSVRWTLIAGAPTATERDGERLLRVLRHIAERSPLPLRIGANLGVVFVGDMGHPRRCTFIVMGDATNLAARLMGKAQPGEIIAGERLHDTCPRRFESVPLQPFVVKGKRAPVQAYLVGRVVEADAGAAYRSGQPEMVGRDDELAELRRVIADGGVVDLVGEVGSGKTRLWQEARNADSSRRWLVMRAEPHEVNSPYLPFRRLIRTAARIGGRDDEAAAGVSLATFVKRSAKPLVPWLPLIADVIGAEVPLTRQVEALDPAFRVDRLRSATAELLVALAGRDGVIVVEDVHWLDDASRSLLESLCAIPDRRVAVVLTRRPDATVASTGTTIELHPIDDEWADRLLLRELPAEAASDANLARLRSSAAGNPLYLIELAQAVAGSTSSTGDPAASWTGSYPSTIERLLAARIDQLPTSGRELVRDVSVLGSTVDRRFASRVLDRPDLVAGSTWERELGDLVIVDEERASFRNELLRVAAYEGLSVRRRRAVHRRAGEVIDEWGDGVPLDDPIAALAFHASGSGIPERIVQWGTEAAEVAIDKGATEIAEGLLHDVVAAQRRLSLPEPTRCATYRRLAFAAERAGHPDAALDALGEAARLADERERASIAVDRARLLEKLGRYRPALALTARAIKACPDSEVGRRLLLARATIKNFQGRWRECLELCHTILDDAETGDDQHVPAQAHLLAEWCCACLGRPERAEHEQAAFALFTELGDSIGLANLYLNRGISAWQESRVTDAIEDFRHGSDHYLRAGDVVGAALADNNVAEILTLQSRLDEAEAMLDNAHRVLRAAGYPLGTVIAMSGLSRIAAWRGRSAEALDLQRDALRRFRELDSQDHVVDSLVRLVEIHVLAGEAAAAAALDAAEEARRALERDPDVPVLPATLARLEARARRLTGDVAGARSLLEEALELGTRDGFDYEVALASLGIGRLDGDDDQVADALARLDGLGVVTPPPGS